MAHNKLRQGKSFEKGPVVLVLGFCLLILLLSPAWAADDLEYKVPLRTSAVVLQQGIVDTSGSRYAVLKLERHLRRAEIDALSARGVCLLSFLGDGFFIAGIDPGALTPETTTTFGIKAAAPWAAENKATPALRRGLVDERARTESGRLKLSLLFFADLTQVEMEQILHRHSDDYALDSPPLLWRATIEPGHLASLLREEGIHAVGQALPLQPVLDDARALVHVDEVQQAVIDSDQQTIRYNGLTGKGVTLQVSEFIYGDHPDFEDDAGQSRVLNQFSFGSGHGTGVAGIMAGSGKQSAQLQDTPFYAPIGRWRGMAPEALLYEDEYYGGQGRQVDASNHSWNWDEAWQSGYGYKGAAVDRQIHGVADPDLQWPQIWAAGNNGSHPQYDDEAGYYAIGSPAKNNIVVGSVNAGDGGLSSFSSLGPTFDGRLKPDVMAPGGKNHVPPQFDLYTDRIRVTIDYIRIYNGQTGTLDASWEFNEDGNTEGWFETSQKKYNIFDVAAAGGYLNFEIGFGPDERGNQNPWGWWDGSWNLAANNNHVIVLRYKMAAAAGSTATTSAFWFHHQGDSDEISGQIRFQNVMDGIWHVTSIPVGQRGLEDGDHFTGWRGTIDRLGMIISEHNGPKLMSTAVYVDKMGNDFFAYRDTQGTSEAAPVVTGGVGLILQQFHRQFNIDIRQDPPLPATIKAILIQTAQDLEHSTADPRDWHNPDTGTPVLYYEGPDFATGYGLANVKAAVDLVAADPGPESALRLIQENELDGYQRHIYELNLTEADLADLAGRLQFTLAWDDFPGEATLPQTAPKLVNDLDLLLVGPDGASYLPWTIDPLPVADCGGSGPGCGDRDPIAPADVQPARKGSDHLNNVEMVTVDYPSPGRWLVMVSAYDMPMPLQSYALVGNQPIKLVAAREGGITSRVSLNMAGTEADAGSHEPALSANGRFVAFSSAAANLVSGDNNDLMDIFVHELETGQMVRVSVSSAGTEGNGDAYAPAITPDGRFVAFQSNADNLVPNDRNQATDIFVHDRDVDQDAIFDEVGAVSTSRVSLNSAGQEGNNSAYLPQISAAGRFVVFESMADNLVGDDSNDVSDIFVHDTKSKQTTRISQNAAGEQGNNYANSPAISADGRFVAFESWSDNLVGGDNNQVGDIFVHDRSTGQMTRVSQNSLGDAGNDSSFSPAISADGRYVAFWSYAENLVYADTNGWGDVFVHDRQTGITSRVSVDSAGNQSDNGTAYPTKPAISTDGRFVGFISDAANLDVADTNNQTDAFVHDRQSGQTVRVSVGSNGNQANSWSTAVSLADGDEIVVFSSAAGNLVSNDTNETDDIFIRRRFLSRSNRLFLPIAVK